MKAKFAQWLKEVDGVIGGICGLGHNDIADQTWYDWFADGYSPEEAAQEALENEGFAYESVE